MPPTFRLAALCSQAPTLNSAAASSSGTAGSDGTSGSSGSAVEKLLMRWIPRPSPANVFVGDVVAFSSPLAQAATQPQARVDQG